MIIPRLAKFSGHIAFEGNATVYGLLSRNHLRLVLFDSIVSRFDL